jgi:DDE superfamily endonuclease
MWCIPPKQSAEFVYHMEDVLAVYCRPADPRRPVVCLDERSTRLIGEVRTPLPSRPGRAERHDCEYVRNGVANLFLAFEPLGGWRAVRVTEQRCRVDWAGFVRGLVDGRYKDAERIVLVMDQLNTHSPASLYEAFPPAEAKRLADRLEIHHTPKHGSWLNMAELELSAFGRDLPPRIGDQETLTRHAAAWEHQRNAIGTRAKWQFTTADARIRLHKLYPTMDG